MVQFFDADIPEPSTWAMLGLESGCLSELLIFP